MQSWSDGRELKWIKSTAENDSGAQTCTVDKTQVLSGMYMGKLIRRLKNKVKSNQRMKIIPEPKVTHWLKPKCSAECICAKLIWRLKIKWKVNRPLLQIPEIKTARGLKSESPAEFISYCLIQRWEVKGWSHLRLWGIPEHEVARWLKAGSLAE